MNKKLKRLLIVSTIVILFSLEIVLLSSFLTVSPQDVRVTNLTDQAAVVSYITNKPSSGEVLVSTRKWRLLLPFMDRFLAVSFKDEVLEKSTVHYLTITNLVPDYIYYYKIAGSGKILTLKTKQPQEKIGQPVPAYGHVFERDKKTSAKSVIIYAGELSTLTNSEGNWTMDLSSIAKQEQQKGEVAGGLKGSANFVFDANRFQPVQNIVLK